MDEYERLYASSNRLFQRSLDVLPEKNIAYLALTGAASATLGDRVPEKDRQQVWRRGLDGYLKLEQAQSEQFDKMPVHDRGEVLGGIVQLSQRMGETTRAQSYAERIVQTLAGTPYEAPARALIANPTAEHPVKVGCLSCHDENRLEPFTARLTSPETP